MAITLKIVVALHSALSEYIQVLVVGSSGFEMLDPVTDVLRGFAHVEHLGPAMAMHGYQFEPDTLQDLSRTFSAEASAWRT